MTQRAAGSTPSAARPPAKDRRWKAAYARSATPASASDQHAARVGPAMGERRRHGTAELLPAPATRIGALAPREPAMPHMRFQILIARSHHRRPPIPARSISGALGRSLAQRRTAVVDADEDLHGCTPRSARLRHRAALRAGHVHMRPCARRYLFSSPGAIISSLV